jgi:hypothetical protein
MEDYQEKFTLKAMVFLIRRWSIKLFHWEYWPIWVVYFPLGFYYIYLSIRSKSFFFFSASNPTIESGGMFFESKWKIFELIPKEYYPKTLFVGKQDNLMQVAKNMEIAGINYPIIAKPDRGERGWRVRKIKRFEELNVYKSTAGEDFLIQSYVDAPLEFSVFYYRHPKSETGTVTSITLKKLLTITSDGYSSIEELILKDDRAFLQYHKLKKSQMHPLNKILQKDEEYNLVPYGNHVLGAKFLNYNHLIDDELNASFDTISKQINGFYYGRFDLRCKSIEDLKNGKISILELNGASAEPAHIYDPNYSFFAAQAVLFKHYTILFTIAKENHKRGTPYMSFSDFQMTRKLEKEYKERMKDE